MDRRPPVNRHASRPRTAGSTGQRPAMRHTGQRGSAVGNPRAQPTPIPWPLIIIIAVLIAGVVLVVSLLNQPKQVKLIWGSLGESRHVDAIVIRDEQVQSATPFSHFRAIIPEGGRAKQGDDVLTLYAQGYDEKKAEELAIVQQEIQEYQQNHLLKDIVNADLSLLNNKIQLQTDAIAQLVSEREWQQLPAMETQLVQLTQERREYLRRTVQADDTLRTLYEREAALQQLLDSLTQVEKAPEDGIISYSSDGLEPLLTPEKIGQIYWRDYQSILNSKPAPLSNPSLFRIVRTGQWFVVMNLPSDMEKLAGEEIVLHLDAVPEHSFEGKVIASDQGCVAVAMYDSPERVLALRQVKATIGQQMEGYIVPIKALHTRDGVVGVLWAQGEQGGRREQGVFIPVDILLQSQNQALIVSKDTPLQVDMSLWLP